MLKWFILTVVVLLSIIGVLVWRLSLVSSQVAKPVAQKITQSDSQKVDAQLINPQTFTKAQVKDLFHKRGCVNCHDSQNTLVGPPFNAIAKQYEADAEARATLFNSLRSGSAGKWGEVHSMPGHNEQSVSDAEATAMINWLLESENSQ